MKPKLNKFTDVLRQGFGKVDVIYGFDRVTIWLDIPECPISEAVLEDHCTHVEVTVMQMKRNARWKLKIALFQPTTRCLRLLEDAMGYDIAALITYVEIAFDLPATSPQQAREKRNSFLAAAKMLFQRAPVMLSEHGTIFYFGPREKQKGEKWERSRRVIAVYADMSSKLNNARPAADGLPCAHIEYRVSGSVANADVGIVSLSDLIGFDHFAFWNTAIRLFDLPMRKDLGRRLADAEGRTLDVTDAALRKRAAKWMLDFSIQDSYGCNFIMHNALLAHPKFCRVFKTMSFATWLDQVQRM